MARRKATRAEIEARYEKMERAITSYLMTKYETVPPSRCAEITCNILDVAEDHIICNLDDEYRSGFYD